MKPEKAPKRPVKSQEQLERVKFNWRKGLDKKTVKKILLIRLFNNMKEK